MVQAQQPTSQVVTLNGAFAGQPDGPVALRLRLYNVDTGGTILFEETQTVTVTAEKFTVRIGNATGGGIPISVFRSNPSVWIAFALDSTPDTQIGPRTAITSSSYAHTALTLPGPVVSTINTLSGDVSLAGSPHLTITQQDSTLTFDVAGVLTGVNHDLSLSGEGTGVGFLTVAAPLELTASAAGGGAVSGINLGSGSGVRGMASGMNGIGMFGEAHIGPLADGVFGQSVTGNGVHGKSNSTSSGVYGENNAGNGGFGVAGYASAPNGVGVWGKAPSGWSFFSDGNVHQERTGGGWVKAMILVNAYQSPYRILRCFNSALAGPAATTPPCGIVFTELSLGTWDFDFGFRVDDRLLSATVVREQTGYFNTKIQARPSGGPHVAVETRDPDGSGRNGYFFVFVF
jgi:hypothetical protein